MIIMIEMLLAIILKMVIYLFACCLFGEVSY